MWITINMAYIHGSVMGIRDWSPSKKWSRQLGINAHSVGWSVLNFGRFHQLIKNSFLKPKILVGGLEHVLFSQKKLGMSSSQVTNSYFSEGWLKTTNQNQYQTVRAKTLGFHGKATGCPSAIWNQYRVKIHCKTSALPSFPGYRSWSISWPSCLT